MLIEGLTNRHSALPLPLPPFQMQSCNIKAVWLSGPFDFNCNGSPRTATAATLSKICIESLLTFGVHVNDMVILIKFYSVLPGDMK